MNLTETGERTYRNLPSDKVKFGQGVNDSMNMSIFQVFRSITNVSVPRSRSGRI